MNTSTFDVMKQYLHNITLSMVYFGNNALVSAGNFDSGFVTLNLAHSVKGLDDIPLLSIKHD